MVKRFSTHDIADSERFDYWQGLIESTYYTPTYNRRLSSEGFDGSLEVKRFGGSLITRIKSTPIEYCDYHPDQNDNILVTLSFCQRAILTQNGRTFEQKPGDILVYDSAQPFSCHFPNGDDQMVMSIPRGLFLSHFNQPDKVINQVLPSHSLLGNVSVSLLQSIWQVQEQDSGVGDKMISSMLTMLDSAYDAENGPLLSLKASEKLYKVQKYLLDRIDDSLLTIESIAKDNNMSARTLNRLFAAEQTTVMRWLWQQRLSACYKALLSRRYSTITETAFTFGFSNMTHFSRLFKETYGITAKQLLDKKSSL